MAEQRGGGGGWGTEKLGSYPAGNGEPVKAVELGSSWSDLHFGKISLAVQCPLVWGSLPFGESSDPKGQPSPGADLQVAKEPTPGGFKSFTMCPKLT